MRRLGWIGVVLGIVLVSSACGGGKTISSPSTRDHRRDRVHFRCLQDHPAPGDRGGREPRPTITVTVIADTGSSLRPGLFKGSVDAVQAWARYVNANGGLACRRVIVKTADSKLTENDAENGITTACGNSFAMVGTTALFLDNMKPAEQCKDKAGAATGIPDLAVIQTYAAEQCSPISFAALPFGGACPYSGSGVRTFQEHEHHDRLLPEEVRQ